MNPNVPNFVHKRLLQLQLSEIAGSPGVNTNDSFMTADGTANDSTQFFSVLEESTSETILENISFNNLDDNEHGLTFTNNSSNNGNENVEEESKGLVVQDVVIFKSSLSPTLYGLQVSQDQEGNLQKYQYEVIENDKGEYVSIPSTFKVVPYETTPTSVISKIENLQDHQSQIAVMTSVESTGNIDEEQSTAYSHNSQQAFAQEVSEKLNVEISISDYDSPASNSTEQSEYIGPNGIPTDLDLDYQENLQIAVDDSCNHDNSHSSTEHTKLDQEDYSELCLDIAETNTEDALAEHFMSEDTNESIASTKQGEQMENKTPLKECILESALKCIYSPLDSDSNNEELYFKEQVEEDVEPEAEIVHLQNVRNQSGSGHRTIAVYPICKQELKEARQQLITLHIAETPVPKLMSTANAAPLKSLNTLKRQHGNAYATVVSAQKENLVLPTTRPSNSCLVSPTKRIIRKVDVAINKSSKATNSEREKKKVLPAWNVNSMISETKIIEAPVRQERLPRKQKIKLMDRVGEELEFQRVTVSANGTIKTLRAVPKSKKWNTAYIEESEEEDDNVALKTLQQNVQRQDVKIVISDSEEENESAATKNKQIDGIDIVVSKAEQMSVVKDKSDNQCIKCSKSFPSMGSLKTHMHIHTIEETKKEGREDDIKIKHQCKVCLEKFINAFLCNKHEKLHLARLKNECNICKKLFKNMMELSTHKKTHGATGSALSNMMERRTIRKEGTSSKSETNSTGSKGNLETSKSDITSAIDKKRDKFVQDRRDHRKSRLSISASRKSIVPPRKSSVAVTTRRSMMPVLTKPSVLPSNPTRKSVAPAKMGPSTEPFTRRSVLSKATVPPIGQSPHPKPAASTLPKPANPNRAAKAFKCLSCNAILQDKVLLDNHIINKCVKTPRRLPKSRPQNTTMPSRSTYALSIESKSASDLDKIDRAKSQSTSTLNNVKIVSVSRRTMGKFSPTSKSTQNLEPASNSKKAPLSARHRIPMNAGIPLNARMKQPFMNLKRKLMENDESDDESSTEK